MEVSVTYEVLENIGTYEKIEYWKDDSNDGRKESKNYRSE